MKRLIAILLAILMIVSAFVSCGGNDETTTTETTTTEPPTPEPPAEDNNDNNDTEGVYGNAILYKKPAFVVHSHFHYKHVLDTDKDREDFDYSHKVPNKVTIKINGENITFDYENSRSDTMLGSIISYYRKEMGVGNYCKAKLYEDGTIRSLRISGDLLPIGIPENATQEEVISYAKEFLSQYNDVSQYNRIECKINSLGEYTVNLYNMVNGYVTNRAVVNITAEGKVYRIIIDKLQKKITSLNVDKEKAEELIIQVVKDAHTDPLVQLISYEINKEYTRAHIINNKTYLRYYCTVNVKLLNEEYTYEPNFLVPYDLVKVE